MEKYLDLELVDYGFIYKNYPVFMQGDANWFLMQKDIEKLVTQKRVASLSSSKL
ncbi:MAG: hypothetical protein JJV94_02935 [Sulfurospirillum sp.]|nr:hypothetical protein [Sulfurospirillum sp.]